MKKFVTLFVAIVLVLSMVASASAITIGASIRKYDDTFLTEMRNHMKEKADELGVEIDFTDSKADQTTQNNNIDLYLTKGYEALAVNMQERSAANVVIEKANVDDVPVVFFNTEPEPEALAMSDKVYYVGAKAEESGTMQGVALAAYWDAHPEADLNGDGKIQYVMIKGEPGHQDAELRTEYSIKYLTDNGYEVECLAEDTAMWDRVKGQDKMATFLAAHPDEIEAVFANNDDMALGAINALQAVGYNKPGEEGSKIIPVFGVDAVDAAKEKIAAGEMTGTIKQDAVGMADAVATITANLIAGKGAYEGLNENYKVVDNWFVQIPYAEYTGE